jgi:5,10-methylenetetrahydromethanopterin reductase
LRPKDYVRLAVKAEEYGFGCVWLQEGSSWGALPLASSILDSTTRIRVGSGIVSPFSRHPHSLAADAAVLSEASGGRFILGIGSAPTLLRAWGLDVSQLAGMREAVEVLRNLLKGRPFTYEGSVFRYESPSSLRLPMGKQPPPIYLGALQPRMIRLAAEVGDGLLISRRGGSSPRYVKEVLRLVEQERRRSRKHKGGPFSVCSFVESSIDTDRERAVKTIRRVLASYTIPSMPATVLRNTGVGLEEVRGIRDARGRRPGDLASSVSREVVRELSMTGTPQDCLEKLESLADTGLEVPILYLHGPSIDKALDLAGTDILPHATRAPLERRF